MSHRGSWYFELFLKAFKDGQNDKARAYLEYSGMRDLNRHRILGETLLNVAIGRGDFEMARLFLSKGADPNIQSDVHETALHRAARCGRPEFIPLLLRAGADIERQASHSLFTPFVTAFNACLLAEGAAQERLFESLRALVRHGADPDTAINGLTPQMVARNGRCALLSDYLDDSVEVNIDRFYGKLYQKQINIHNVLVNGIRKPAHRPLNFMIFAARGEFSKVIHYMALHHIPLKPADFSFRINGRFNTVRLLSHSGEIDLLLKPDLWRGRPGLLREFRTAYKNDAPAAFWEKFDRLEQGIYQNHIQRNIRSPLVERRRK